jgi:hypothetical protein
MAETLALVRGAALIFLFRPPVHVFGIGKRKGKPDFACRLGRLFSLSLSLSLALSLFFARCFRAEFGRKVMPWLYFETLLGAGGF